MAEACSSAAFAWRPRLSATVRVRAADSSSWVVWRFVSSSSDLRDSRGSSFGALGSVTSASSSAGPSAPSEALSIPATGSSSPSGDSRCPTAIPFGSSGGISGWSDGSSTSSAAASDPTALATCRARRSASWRARSASARACSASSRACTAAARSSAARRCTSFASSIKAWSRASSSEGGRSASLEPSDSDPCTGPSALAARNVFCFCVTARHILAKSTFSLASSMGTWDDRTRTVTSRATAAGRGASSANSLVSSPIELRSAKRTPAAIVARPQASASTVVASVDMAGVLCVGFACGGRSCNGRDPAVCSP